MVHWDGLAPSSVAFQTTAKTISATSAWNLGRTGLGKAGMKGTMAASSMRLRAVSHDVVPFFLRALCCAFESV